MNSSVNIVILSVLSTFAASSGFWTYVMSKSSKKNANTRLIMGLAYIKACELGFSYIEHGCVSRDELEDFTKYLYNPYIELGGNGVLERIMKEIKSLPIIDVHKYNKYEEHK